MATQADRRASRTDSDAVKRYQESKARRAKKFGKGGSKTSDKFPNPTKVTEVFRAPPSSSSSRRSSGRSSSKKVSLSTNEGKRALARKTGKTIYFKRRSGGSKKEERFKVSPRGKITKVGESTRRFVKGSPAEKRAQQQAAAAERAKDPRKAIITRDSSGRVTSASAKLKEAVGDVTGEVVSDRQAQVLTAYASGRITEGDAKNIKAQASRRAQKSQQAQRRIVEKIRTGEDVRVPDVVEARTGERNRPGYTLTPEDVALAQRVQQEEQRFRQREAEVQQASEAVNEQPLNRPSNIQRRDERANEAVQVMGGSRARLSRADDDVSRISDRETRNRALVGVDGLVIFDNSRSQETGFEKRVRRTEEFEASAAGRRERFVGKLSALPFLTGNNPVQSVAKNAIADFFSTPDQFISATQKAIVASEGIVKSRKNTLGEIGRAGRETPSVVAKTFNPTTLQGAVNIGLTVAGGAIAGRAASKPRGIPSKGIKGKAKVSGGSRSRTTTVGGQFAPDQSIPRPRGGDATSAPTSKITFKEKPKRLRDRILGDIDTVIETRPDGRVVRSRRLGSREEITIFDPKNPSRAKVVDVAGRKAKRRTVKVKQDRTRPGEFDAIGLEFDSAQVADNIVTQRARATRKEEIAFDVAGQEVRGTVTTTAESRAVSEAGLSNRANLDVFFERAPDGQKRIVGAMRQNEITSTRLKVVDKPKPQESVVSQSRFVRENQLSQSVTKKGDVFTEVFEGSQVTGELSPPTQKVTFGAKSPETKPKSTPKPVTTTTARPKTSQPKPKDSGGSGLVVEQQPLKDVPTVEVGQITAPKAPKVGTIPKVLDGAKAKPRRSPSGVLAAAGTTRAQRSKNRSSGRRGRPVFADMAPLKVQQDLRLGRIDQRSIMDAVSRGFAQDVGGIIGSASRSSTRSAAAPMSRQRQNPVQRPVQRQIPEQQQRRIQKQMQRQQQQSVFDGVFGLPNTRVLRAGRPNLPRVPQTPIVPLSLDLPKLSFAKSTSRSSKKKRRGTRGIYTPTLFSAFTNLRAKTAPKNPISKALGVRPIVDLSNSKRRKKNGRRGR